MSIEIKNQPNVETMFNKQEYNDSVLDYATTYPDDDSARIHCKSCGKEEHDWKIGSGPRESRSMPDSLCIACWANETANGCLEAWADMPGAG